MRGGASRAEEANSIEAGAVKGPVLPTRALLACGALAGPSYVTATVLQALLRDGFDAGQHRFTLLTAGDLGWIHRSSMLLVGVLTVLFAVGVGRILGTGRGATWGPRLLGLFGAAYVLGGMLQADAVVGFPPGTIAERVQTTWQGVVQNASRGVSTLLLLLTSLAIAAWFAAGGRRVYAWLYGAGIPVVFAILAAVGAAMGIQPAAPAFLLTPWIWVTALAVHLYRGGAGRRPGIPVGRRAPFPEA